MAMKVPKPAEGTWKSVQALEESLNKYLTEFEMETFKSTTRLIAKQHFGDILRPPEDYSDTEWNKFVELVHARCNSIGRFVDAWPLRAYYRLYRKYSRIDPLKESSPIQEKECVPPKPHRPRSVNPTKSTLARPRKTQALPEKRLYRLPPTPPQTPPINGSNGNLHSFVLACPTCAFIPTIPAICTIGLDQLTEGLDHARHIFRLGGLLHDYHIDCLKRWSEKRQVAFLEALVKNGLAPIDKALIWKRLKLHKIPLPIPSSDEEILATEPTTTHHALQRLMKLDDVESFQKILDIFEKLWNENKNICHLDRKKWKQFIERGCELYPALLQYQGAWPLKVLLKRKVTIRPGNKSQPPVVRRDWIHFLPLKYSTEASSPRLTWVACPMHGCAGDLQSCDSHVRGLLKTYGCEELLPLFMRAGIRTEESWERFCELERDEKMALLESIQDFNFTLFQRHLLDGLVSLS
ncbi:hypothetical protein BDN72DRAFT_891396 [Pluteus cervinus]|uniref:Uncharacterized protein n=1 Tax=Pluteus cervinus TaxID=181527 RepID=A0ACD3BDZ4_9AGAR|nr:hypothetical protein BDN72DRAFT_891396 [Pluteus cervinus]